ncbi:MAG: bifunctional phosphopantothenoylcysteine decarboxylase/phosphopantothenate--cysteine ligase CoaBC [Halolamina sp.]
MLEGVNVALAVSGSVAAVKTVELAHELRRQGASVRAVMSESATNIVHPWAVDFATDEPVVTEITGAVEHVELCGRDGWADVLVCAPATANTVGKIAAAVDDTPITTCATTALGADLPVVVVPAMHEPMYDHPGVLDAIDRVESWGVEFVDPRIEEGKAKIATEDAVVTGVARATTPDPLAGESVVVTAGATAEAVDPIRVLTNRSSGRTGRAVARSCHVRGADVTLVHGTHGAGAELDPEAVHYADLRAVESAAEMLDATQVACDGADALVSTAAVADYTVEAADEKIRSGQELTLSLSATPKLIDEVAAAYPDLAVVAFKAETEGDDAAMVDRAAATRDRVGCAFVVANDASVMGETESRALLVGSDHGDGDREEDGDGDREVDEVEAFEGSKTALGARVADELADALATAE